MESRARAVPEKAISPRFHPTLARLTTGDGRSDWGMSSPGRTGQKRRIKVRIETSCQLDSFRGQLARAGMQRAWTREGLACQLGILGGFI